MKKLILVLLMFLSVGPLANAFNNTPDSDLNGDGVVTLPDYAMLAEDWLGAGSPPGPPPCIPCYDPNLIDPVDPNIYDIVDLLVCTMEMITCYDWYQLSVNEQNLLQGYHDMLVGEGAYTTKGLFSGLKKAVKKVVKVVEENAPDELVEIAKAVAEYVPDEIKEFEDLLWDAAESTEEKAMDMANEASNQMQKTINNTFEKVVKYIPPEVIDAGEEAYDTVKETNDEAMSVIGFKRKGE